MADELTPEQTTQKASALDHPLWLPPDFRSYLEDFASRVATDFFIPQSASFRAERFETASPVDTVSACTHTAGWGDCNDGAGPQLTGLSNGQYIFIMGADIGTSDGYASLGIEINGHSFDYPFNLQEIRQDSQGTVMGVIAVGPDLDANSHFMDADDNNTARMVYSVGTSGRTFGSRWMHAVKVRTK